MEDGLRSQKIPIKGFLKSQASRISTHELIELLKMTARRFLNYDDYLS